MGIIRLPIYVLLTAFLAGCWGATIPHEVPKSLDDPTILEPLIGQTSIDVIEKLGLPDQFLTDGLSKFMIYHTLGDGTDIMFLVWIPLPVPDYGDNYDDSALHCLRIEIDTDDRVRKYKIKSGGWMKMFSSHNKLTRCREFFWSKKELTKIRMTTDFPATWIPSAWKEVISLGGIEGLAKEKAERLAIEEAFKRKKISSLRNSLSKYMTTSELRQLAMVGNPYAQFRLYRELMESEPTTAYRWLCKSADNGHPQARHTLGQISEYSKQGHVQAYVWYALSSYSQLGKFNEESLQSFVDKNLSAEEYQKARMALLEWRPGQCLSSLS